MKKNLLVSIFVVTFGIILLTGCASLKEPLVEDIKKMDVNAYKMLDSDYKGEITPILKILLKKDDPKMKSIKSLISNNLVHIPSHQYLNCTKIANDIFSNSHYAKGINRELITLKNCLSKNTGYRFNFNQGEKLSYVVETKEMLLSKYHVHLSTKVDSGHMRNYYVTNGVGLVYTEEYPIFFTIQSTDLIADQWSNHRYNHNKNYSRNIKKLLIQALDELNIPYEIIKKQ